MAKPIRYGAMHMSNNRNFEVQRTNHFEIIIEGFADELTLAVTSYSFPSVSIETIPLHYGNTNVNVAGKKSIGEGSIKVKDFILSNTEKTITDWFDQVIQWDDESMGWAADYKRTGRLYQYAPDGTNPRVWKISGIFPTALSFPEFSHEGSDVKAIDLTLSIDKVERPE